MFWQALPPSCDTSRADMTVPCHNRMGSILYRKNKRQRDAIVGMKSYPICSSWFLNFFLWTVHIYIFYFLKLNEKCPNTWSNPSHITPEPLKMVFGIKKLIRGPKKWQKEVKKSINRSWQLIITIADLEIDSGEKKTFDKSGDFGSYSGWNDHLSGPSKYKLSPLAI